MKYKAGDKVRVRKDLKVGKDYGKDYNFNDDMAEMRGKTVTIEKKYDDCYWLKETSCWWTDEMLEPVEDIIEYKGKKYDILDFDENGICTTNAKTYYNKTCLVLKEYKEEILDETEKRYLRNVIKYVIEPTHQEIKYIIKRKYSDGHYIAIIFKNYRSLLLPKFEDKIMYKGMELDKEYTLEDLQL